jgi:hypothetical protein
MLTSFAKYLGLVLTNPLLLSKILPVQQRSGRHVDKSLATMNCEAIQIQLEPSPRSPSDECEVRCARGIPKYLHTR